MEVTVIIPVHNSEKYLKECIESVLSQTFCDMEILCIDGGSKDLSPEIIRELAKKDSRIQYIQDPDTGYGHKINMGIYQAKGRYIAILESDDKMCPDMIERLHCIAEAYEADVVDADYYEMISQGPNALYRPVKKYFAIDSYNCILEYEDISKREVATNGIWTGLYRKTFINRQGIKLNESSGASFQDLSFLFLTSTLAQRIYHVGEPLYQYRIDNIGSSVKDNRKIFEIVGECEFLKNDLLKRNIRNGRMWELYYIRKYNAYYWNYCRLSSEARNVFLEKYEEELRQDIETGQIRRKLFPEGMYYRTFLLLDDRGEFVCGASGSYKNMFTERIFHILEKTYSRKLVIFGAGILGTELITLLLQNKIAIDGICDNSASLHGKFQNGIKILSVNHAVTEFPDAVYVIVNRKHGREMEDQLMQAGIAKENIINFTENQEDI